MVWTKVADNTGLDATSVYDASGMRIAEKVNDVGRFLIYDIGGRSMEVCFAAQSLSLPNSFNIGLKLSTAKS